MKLEKLALHPCRNKQGPFWGLAPAKTLNLIQGKRRLIFGYCISDLTFRTKVPSFESFIHVE